MFNRLNRQKLFFGVVVLVATALASGCATQPPAEQPAAAPAPAPAAPKAEQPAAPAPKTVTEKISFASAVNFDFDKYAIRSDARAKLDDVLGKLKDKALEVIIAIGHADRIGTDAYNQRLSVQRAEAVKAYLVSRGVQANRIYTEGKGRTQSVASGECKGMGPENGGNQKLVDCLAPHRRTNIEVVGTQTVTR